MKTLPKQILFSIGLTNFGDKSTEVVLKELTQIKMIQATHSTDLCWNKKAEALESQMFLEEKHSSKIKEAFVHMV